MREFFYTPRPTDLAEQRSVGVPPGLPPRFFAFLSLLIVPDHSRRDAGGGCYCRLLAVPSPLLVRDTRGRHWGVPCSCKELPKPRSRLCFSWATDACWKRPKAPPSPVRYHAVVPPLGVGLPPQAPLPSATRVRKGCAIASSHTSLSTSEGQPAQGRGWEEEKKGENCFGGPRLRTCFKATNSPLPSCSSQSGAHPSCRLNKTGKQCSTACSMLVRTRGAVGQGEGISRTLDLGRRSIAIIRPLHG